MLGLMTGLRIDAMMGLRIGVLRGLKIGLGTKVVARERCG